MLHIKLCHKLKTKHICFICLANFAFTKCEWFVLLLGEHRTKDCHLLVLQQCPPPPFYPYCYTTHAPPCYCHTALPQRTLTSVCSIHKLPFCRLTQWPRIETTAVGRKLCYVCATFLAHFPNSSSGPNDGAPRMRIPGSGAHTALGRRRLWGAFQLHAGHSTMRTQLRQPHQSYQFAHNTRRPEH